MSRIGIKPIQIPENVKVSIQDNFISVSGPEGELQLPITSNLAVKVEDGSLIISRKSETKQAKSDHGSLKAKLENAVFGVTQGWKKILELVGAGYRARLEGEELVLAIGFSHPVKFDARAGIKYAVEENRITVFGIDKTLVGQIAANIRATRPPDVYKGKGVKYMDERIRRKPGKAAKTAAA